MPPCFVMARNLFQAHHQELTVQQSLKANKKHRCFTVNSIKLDLDFPMIGRITRSDNSALYRFMWATILFVCLLLSIYHAWDRISYYRSSPIATSMGMTRNLTLQYPMMTACTTSTSGDMLLRKTVANSWQSDKCAFNELAFIDNVEDILNMTYAQILDVVRLDRDLDQSCYLEPIPSSLDEAMCTVESTRSFKGSCLTLSARYPPIFGSHNTFKLLGRLPDEYCTPSQIWILIHDEMFDIVWKSLTELDFIQMDYLPGIDETIPISVAEFTYLSTPSKPCTDADSYNRCFRKYFDDAVEAANLSCSTKEIGAQHLQTCSSFDDVIELDRKLYQAFNPNKIPCPRKCHEVIYRRSYGRKTKNYYLDDYSVGIEYLDNVISVSEEYYLYSFISLLCDLGGSVGLFLGICVMSLFETLETCCTHFLRHKCNHKMPAGCKTFQTV